MAPDTIRLGGAYDFVELHVLERGTPEGHNEGDLRFHVSVGSDEFRGRYDWVWVARQDLLAFIDALRSLERERSGATSVQSISPQEFRLSLEAVGRGRRIVASGILSRYHFWPDAPTGRSEVAFRLDVDPSRLRELVDAFEKLGQAHA